MCPILAVYSPEAAQEPHPGEGTRWLRVGEMLQEARVYCCVECAQVVPGCPQHPVAMSKSNPPTVRHGGLDLFVLSGCCTCLQDYFH